MKGDSVWAIVTALPHAREQFYAIHDDVERQEWKKKKKPRSHAA